GQRAAGGAGRRCGGRPPVDGLRARRRARAHAADQRRRRTRGDERRRQGVRQAGRGRAARRRRPVGTLGGVETRLRRPLSGERVHFVAIGGVGMAALAELLVEMGYTVSGSDLKQSRTVSRLLELGADVKVGPHRAHYADHADHVVFSNAVRSDNPEVARGRETGAEVMTRAQLLGRLVDAGRGVAVTGTHGKTTTSSMVARVLAGTGFEPSFIIGGDLNDVGTGAALGASDIVVAEADEAFGSFLEVHPEIAVVTSIDRDHLEHYEGQSDIDDAFVSFLEGRRGWAVLCADDAGIARIRGRIT